VWKALRHAFAIEPASAFAPTAAEAELVRRVCVELVRRRLTLPASVLVESSRPLGYVGAQILWFAYPWFAALTDAAGLKTLARMLERPGAVDYVLDRLQAADQADTVPPQKPRDRHSWDSSSTEAPH
jgi:hypothetical protein